MAATAEAMARSLKTPRAVLLLVPAGAPVDAAIIGIVDAVTEG